MWVDPANPDVVVVAALGRTYSKNEQRGVFKTTDGGKTWKKVLYEDDVTGAVDSCFAPGNSKIGYAALMEHYTRPGARAAIESTGKAGIYKTTDGGDTWTQLKEGLPGGRLGRIGVATNADGQKVFAIVAGGRRRTRRGTAGSRRSVPVRRWRRALGQEHAGFAHSGQRLFQPRLSRPEQFGRRLRGADIALPLGRRRQDLQSHTKARPGGDDNHALWIDPKDSSRMIMASDQGATISMDGGKSWSSWYNQPTGQIYHLSTDNRYPYWVYGTQQDSGSVGTLSRGDYGEITFMDWDPVGGYEFGYIVPDPLNNNLVYAGGPSRGVVRIDRTNRQVATVSPSVARGDIEYRTAQNPPLGFSPDRPAHPVLWVRSFCWKRAMAESTGRQASPDLTKRATAVPVAPPAPLSLRSRRRDSSRAAPRAGAAGDHRAHEPDAINTFSPSPVAAKVIWAGTNNGVVQLTKDGGARGRMFPAGLHRADDDQHRSKLRTSTPRPPIWRWIATKRTISNRISTARTIRVRRGRRPSAGFPTAISPAWFAKTR
jgi:hypothetical protein